MKFASKKNSERLRKGKIVKICVPSGIGVFRKETVEDVPSVALAFIYEGINVLS